MTKKPKLRKHEPFWFDGGPLPLKLAYCATVEAWNIAIKQMGLDPAVETYPDNAGRCTTFDGIAAWPELTVLITINRRKGLSNVQIAGLIAHEAMHMVQELTRKMFPYNEHARLDQETEAYLIQWATQNIYGAYLEHGK